MKSLKGIARRLFDSLGFRITRIPSDESVIESEFGDIYRACKPYTMTTRERMYALYKSVEYIVKANIPGDFVECGVWMGGSSMVIASTLKKMGVTDRKIYMYDTYVGMSAPTDNDVQVKDAQRSASLLMNASQDKTSQIWCVGPIEEVQANMAMTGYPKENIVFIKGMVEDTIPATLPNNIALLRLDTDFYESTKHELEHLYPLLNVGGVLILDDYGFWAGAKKAVDEYFEQNPILLNRVDNTGRVAVKIK